MCSALYVFPAPLALGKCWLKTGSLRLTGAEQVTNELKKQLELQCEVRLSRTSSVSAAVAALVAVCEAFRQSNMLCMVVPLSDGMCRAGKRSGSLHRV